jgi:hypothetical protein
MQVTAGWQRLRISLVFVIFEGGMPLIGLGSAPSWLTGSARLPITWREPP